MTKPSQPVETPTGTRTERARRSLRIGLIVAALAAVIWFIVANTREVSVQWFIVETRSPLFLVIILSAVLGALIDRLLTWRRSRRK